MCKFDTETNDNKVLYSFSSCMSEIRKNLATKVKSYVGSNMVCLPSCMEQQISYVGSREKNFNKYGDSIMVEIEITSPPTARYFRAVTQTKLDLVVAIGGVIGLFTGASLLNILEIISMIFSKIRLMFKN
ncbi:GL10426 [Drosophila persimilis]|uniref:GL10426 n=1 Tax=Drosophila persimilis TaxID=7234 RepID=B4GCI9_DROPE|nr:GL10426 [Drosophila persimilis]